MAEVTFSDVAKVFPDGTRAVTDLTLDAQDGEFMVLVGPSGCGKTTALRMVAGLEEISEGEIRIGDRVVNEIAPRDRDIAMVFQSYALYPHLTVYDNIAFSLRLRKEKKAEIDKRVKEAARILDLEALLDRKPRALSGGQRQRVAMGRAIVRQPAAFLMDEPLSNLDAKLRVQMRAEISKLQRNIGVTTIYVTHDQVEAMTMGDRVAVMRKGQLQQVAPPQELYDRPLNLFVGGFIGSPAMNLVEGKLVRENGGLVAALGDARLQLDDENLASRPALKSFEGRPLVVGIRPEHLEDASIAHEDSSDRRLTGNVELREALGSELMVHLAIDAPPAMTEEVQELAEDAGTTAEDLQGGDKHRAVVIGRFDADSKVQEGQDAEIAVDTRALHFFDPDTGLAIYDDSNGTKGANNEETVVHSCRRPGRHGARTGRLRGDDEEGGTEAGDGSITVFSLWGGSEQEAFQKVLDKFTEDTGIETKYESARDFLPVIRTRLAAGNPPDVAIIPRPGVVAELARDDSLIPLEDMGLDPETINENYSDTWTSLATVDDTLYGVVAKANSKSTIWYKPNSFQKNGFEIPTTWDALLAITQQYDSKGKKTPWAVGAQGRDNSWTLTDWFENIYARRPALTTTRSCSTATCRSTTRRSRTR